MAGELLLGVDIGTSSSKGVLVDAGGAIVARAQLGHDTSRPRPGWFEHDAEAVWWHDFVGLTAELLSSSTGPVAAVAVSGIGPCLLPAAGTRPLRPAILYGIDTRAAEEIELLNERFGTTQVLERGGSPLTSQAVGPKLLWLQRHEPDAWADMTRFYMASSFIVERLTGAYVLDHHSASQCDPLYDLTAADWNRAWCDEVAPALQLPRLRWSGEVAGHIHAAAAAATGLPEGIPVTAGTIDAWAEAESVGVQAEGDVMVMYGTTMFLIARTHRATPTSQLWSTQGVRPDAPTLAAGMATSGAVTSWLSDLVGADHATLSAEAAAVPAGSEGLLLLPYFAGERTPIFDARARGLILGLTLDHQRRHLYRAALEGVAFGVRHNLDVMKQSTPGMSRLVAVGGGTTGDTWTQIVSDVTGLVQELPAERVGAAYGDAMLAAQAIGVATADQTARWNPLVAQVRPSPANSAVYDDRYRLYLDAYADNAAAMHALSG